MRASILTSWVCLSVAASAHADEATRLVREGEALGQQKRYAEALERFRTADAARPDPVHHCWIAISALRLGRAGEAELHLGRCLTAPAPRPPWVEVARQEVARAVASGAYAELAIDTLPAGAEIQVEGYGLSFVAPRSVWVPLGRARVTARAAGHLERTTTIDTPTRGRQPVVLTLDRLPEVAHATVPREPGGPLGPGGTAATEPPRAPAPPALDTPHATAAVSTDPLPALEAPARRAWPWVVLGSSALVAGGGALLHGLAAGARSSALEHARDEPAYAEERASMYQLQDFAYASYGAGLTLVGVAVLGLWLDDGAAAQ
jgi:hypothetical protein